MKFYRMQRRNTNQKLKTHYWLIPLVLVNFKGVQRPRKKRSEVTATKLKKKKERKIGKSN